MVVQPKWLPGKRDKRWLRVLPLATAGMTAVLAGISLWTLHYQPGAADVLILAALSLVAMLAICGFAYAGLHIAAVSAVTGVLAGVIMMTYVFLQPTEWRGIVGLVSGAQLTLVFLLVGVNAQMICYLLKKRGGQK